MGAIGMHSFLELGQLEFQWHPHSVGIPDRHIFYNHRFFLFVQEKTSSEGPIQPAPRIINGTKKYFPIGTKYQYIVDHGVTIVSAVICILLNYFVSQLHRQSQTVHESDDVWYRWFTETCHLRKPLHFLLIQELYSCKRMKAQLLHSHTKFFFRIGEQGKGVIPKIKQSHLIVIWLPR